MGLSDPISVLVKNGRFDSEELAPVTDNIVRLNAEGGVLIGNLQAGAIANFLVLDGNPMEDIAILANTHAHMRLLVRDGQVSRTDLAGMKTTDRYGGDSVDPELSDQVGEPSRILSESGDRKVVWDIGFWSGDVRGVLGLSTQVFDQDQDSVDQVGDLSDFESADVVAARLTLGGYIGRDFRVNYYIDYGYNGFEEGFKLKHDDDFSLYNMEFTFPSTRLGTLSIGRLKAPESISRVMAGQYLTMAIRAVPISVLTASRDNGVRLTNTAFDQRMTWGTGIYNDWLSRSGQSFDETNTYVTGRVTGLPVWRDDGKHLMHLGLSARWTSMESESIRFRGKPGFFVGPDFIDTGDFEGKGAHWLIGEFAWKKGRFMTMAETVKTSVDSPALGNPTFKGSYVWAEWTLTGESRDYNQTKGSWSRPLPTANFGKGGPGLWSIVASWSDTDLDDGRVHGGRLEEYILGVSWYPQKSFRWGIELGRATLDRYGVRGTTNFAQLYLHVTNI